jgi:hypothetical protein
MGPVLLNSNHKPEMGSALGQTIRVQEGCKIYVTSVISADVTDLTEHLHKITTSTEKMNQVFTEDHEERPLTTRNYHGC